MMPINMIKSLEEQIVRKVMKEVTELNTYAPVVEDRYGVFVDPVTEQSIAVRRFTLTNSYGMVVQIINYGATVTSILVPDRESIFRDVVLGYDDLQGYEGNKVPTMAGMVGRVAGRISGSKFNIDSDTYYVTATDGMDSCNGGLRGFNKVMWEPHMFEDHVMFSYYSKDGEEGYPGDLMVYVTFTLTELNELIIETQAQCSKPTPVDLSLHLLMNLAGHDAGKEELMNHELLINSDKYLMVSVNKNATGETKCVGNTWYDFRSSLPLHRMLPLLPNRAYDKFLCVRAYPPTSLRFIARLEHVPSGRSVEISSDQPIVHLYTVRDFPLSESEIELENLKLQEKADAERHNEWLIEDGPKTDLPGDFVDLYPEKHENEDGDEEDYESEEDQDRSETEGEEVEINVIEPEEGDLDDEKRGSNESDTKGDRCPSILQYVDADTEGKVFQKRGLKGKDGAYYCRSSGIGLMTQGYPNAVNREQFPSCLLRPWETYSNKVVYRFYPVRHVEPHVVPEVIKNEVFSREMPTNKLCQCEAAQHLAGLLDEIFYK